MLLLLSVVVMGPAARYNQGSTQKIGLNLNQFLKKSFSKSAWNAIYLGT